MEFRIGRQQYINLIGYSIIVAACIVLVGWQFDIAPLKSLIPSIIPMNPITACTFILCGIWLLIYQKRKFSNLALVICGIVTLVGLVHFVTYFVPLDVRMDF